MTNPPSSQGKERSYEIPYCQTFDCSQSKWTGNILGAFVCVYQFLSVCLSVFLSVCLWYKIEVAAFADYHLWTYYAKGDMPHAPPPRKMNWNNL